MYFLFAFHFSIEWLRMRISRAAFEFHIKTMHFCKNIISSLF